MFFHHIFSTLAASAVTAGMVGAVGAYATPEADGDVAALVAQASRGHASLMRGDIADYRQALALAPDFLLMDPFGSTPTGVPADDAHWARIGRFFRDGRDARFELIRAWRTGDMAVLVANESADVAVGSLSAQHWLLRVTLVFRRDGGAWKLVHRHADPLVKGISLDQASRITRGA
ncbi:ketosteroid isomerase-like protein [Sphingomonas naasensis]|uniref:DUF4440 domain-containing protein n=1 Tax=Sphingomonas naasensis TaxID=1344951 RepID=A0A4S1WQ74_9SPHN|nr:nuclear transport factor 2 family protein [Sphingomonas naasensis]NIJ21049.1 ketosteroid isomerase-like protein [Sphingomonas naasensis]TGX43426.1 DUF4440 domain-containing protein [Sphingomonas naasensis]